MPGLNLQPIETLRLKLAADKFFTTHVRFELPVSHSPRDHVLELERARGFLGSSALLEDGPYLLEVSRPIGDFAASALWDRVISYRNPLNPEGPAVNALTIYPEGNPLLLIDIPAAGEPSHAYKSIVQDLTYALTGA